MWWQLLRCGYRGGRLLRARVTGLHPAAHVTRLLGHCEGGGAALHQWSPAPLSSGAGGLLSPHFGQRRRCFVRKCVPPGLHTACRCPVHEAASVLPVGGHRPVVTAGPVVWRGGEGETPYLWALASAWGLPLAPPAAALLLLTSVAVVVVAGVVVVNAGVVVVASAAISEAGLLAGWAPWPRRRRALHSPCCGRPLAG